MTLKVESLDGLPINDTIRINKRLGKVVAELKFVRFRDKDTRQIVIYIPSIEITGYGSNESTAEEMLNFSINEYFLLLMSMSKEKLEIEMSNLGWVHDKIRSKEFSKSFIDMSGHLQDFNAVENDVEMGVLEF